jgi:type I restriction enzyme, S subunit
MPSEKPNLPFIGMENIEAHTMKLLGTVPAGTMKSSAVHFQPDDVLYGRLRPYLNKVYRPDFEGLCSAEFIVFPKTESIISRYLQYFLNSSSFASYASHLNAGDRPRVDFEQLSPYPFPVAPYEQQQRIVEEIEKQFSRLDEAVASLKRVKANLKRYKAAVLKVAVEGKLTEDWREQHPNVEPASKLLERILAERQESWPSKKKVKEPFQVDTADLPFLPKGWIWVPLEAISEAVGGFAFESKKFTSNGFQVLKMANIRMGCIDLSQKPSFIQDVDADVIARYGLMDGDLVVTLTGTRKKQDYGYVAVVKNAKGILLNQRIARLRPADGVLPQFLALAMQSEDYRNRFFAYETGNVGQGNVGMGAVTKVPIKLAPLAEQHQIVTEVERRLSVIDELEAAVEANLIRADRLRQAILQRSFSGELI